jgi:hypothetical protein
MIIYVALGFLIILVLAIFLYAYRMTDKLFDHVDSEDTTI